MDSRQAVGQRIRELRVSRGLSQEALAERMDANAKYVSSVERGLENPTLTFFEKVASALQVELADLFNFAWLQLNERQLKKEIRAIADRASRDTLVQLVAIMRARGI